MCVCVRACMRACVCGGLTIDGDGNTATAERGLLPFHRVPSSAGILPLIGQRLSHDGCSAGEFASSFVINSTSHFDKWPLPLDSRGPGGHTWDSDGAGEGEGGASENWGGVSYFHSWWTQHCRTTQDKEDFKNETGNISVTTSYWLNSSSAVFVHLKCSEVHMLDVHIMKYSPVHVLDVHIMKYSPVHVLVYPHNEI